MSMAGTSSAKPWNESFETAAPQLTRDSRGRSTKLTSNSANPVARRAGGQRSPAQAPRQAASHNQKEWSTPREFNF